MINNLFLSVGAMKAGTTWLYERLKDHPDVGFTPEKEIHYFANKVGIENQLSYRNRLLKLKSVMGKYCNGNAKFISQNIDEISWYVKYANQEEVDNSWYLSLFDGLEEKKFFADFSNLYCQMSGDGWENVYSVANNVKVIYTLRDPMKRLWSHYKFHHKWVGKEDDVLSDGFGLFKETLNKPWFFKNIDYAGNLRKVKESTREGDLLLLYFEDFRSHPQQQADVVADFLGVSDIVIPNEVEKVKVNATKDFSMPDSWERYARSFIAPFVDEMKSDGLVHQSWGV